MVPGIPALSRRKSIFLYSRLCPPPRKRTVVRPSLFLAPVLRRNDVSDFSGLFFDSSSVVTAVIPRRPGVLGLYALIPILQLSFQHTRSARRNAYYALSYNSNFSPSFSLTKAFFQSDRFPEKRPRRFTFPRTFITFTRSTLTFNKVSTACLI